MLSNTTITRDHVTCQLFPRIQITLLHKWQLRTAHQSNKNFECGDFTIEFENDYIFEFATEVNEETTNENDDVLEENYMMIYVKMINGKTISVKCEGKQTAAVISDEVERRSSIPRDMTYLVHKGKMMSEKQTIKENNIEAEATIEMSLRLLGGMEKDEQMDTHETEEDREKKRKLEEGKEGNATKPNDDMVYLKRDIMEALKRSDAKMDSYSRKTDEKMESYSRKTDEQIESYSKKTDERMDGFSRKDDEMLEKFLLVTNTVGSQIQGMQSSIVSMQEMNEKTKEEVENRFNHFDERITNM